MSNQKLNITTKSNIRNSNIFSHIMTVMVIIGLNAFTGNAKADEVTSTPLTVSYGVSSEIMNDVLRENIIKQNKETVFFDQIIGKATGKTRDEIQQTIQTELTTQESAQTRAFTVSITNTYYPEFTIFNADSYFYNDLDYDGYYQTFGITFDADIYSSNNSDIAQVYALLYLSDNGGPWTHYYTTDDFTLYGDSDQDAYEIISTLGEGFYPSHYDVLIDLYQVGYSGIVATYSSDDDADLYALPLESANNDQVYSDSVYIHHAGSLSWGLLMMIFLVLISRVVSNYKKAPI